MLVVLDPRSPSSRHMLGGVRRQARRHASWRLELVPPHAPPASLRNAAGLVGWLQHVEHRPLDTPAVSVLSTSSLPESLRVHSDPLAGGRLAAEHLLQRDLRRLSVCISPQAKGARRRRAEVFADVAREAGATVDWFELTRFKGEPADQVVVGRLAAWLDARTLPLGLMCQDDAWGLLAVQACGLAGLRVPDGVAVVGHNNDVPICEFCDPPLSSVEPNQPRIGYEAAGLLARLMAGEPPPERPIRVPPVGVVTRGSTDVQHTADPAVASALRYIRDHLADGIGARDVIDHAPASASTLQRRFKDHRGQTVGQALHQARIRRVEQLLLRDGRPLAEVAVDAGYDHLSQMCREFKRATGSTPTAYRHRFDISRPTSPGE